MRHACNSPTEPSNININVSMSQYHGLTCLNMSQLFSEDFGQRTGELINIDFGIAFERGKHLGMPEMVPFRLTRDIVAGAPTKWGMVVIVKTLHIYAHLTSDKQSIHFCNIWLFSFDFMTIAGSQVVSSIGGGDYLFF